MQCKFGWISFWWRRKLITPLRWLKQRCEIIALTIGAAIFLLAIMIPIFISVIHIDERYDSEYYADSMDFIAALAEAETVCAKDKEKRDGGYCKVLNKLINDRTAIHDLGAQETMALATRGLLWSSSLQAIASFLTLGFLFWTVRQTYAILLQSEATTKAAELTLNQAVETTNITRDTHEETRRANSKTLKPYLEITEAKGVLGAGGPDTIHHLFWINLSISIKNIGKTPARMFTPIEIESGGASVKAKQGGQMSFHIMPDSDPEFEGAHLSGFYPGTSGGIEYIAPSQFKSQGVIGIIKTNTVIPASSTNRDTEHSLHLAQERGLEYDFDMVCSFAYKDDFTVLEKSHYRVRFHCRGSNGKIEVVEIISESIEPIADGSVYDVSTE